MRHRLALIALLATGLVSGLATGCSDPPPKPPSAPPPPDPSIAAAEALDALIAATPDGPDRVELQIQRAVVMLKGARRASDWEERLEKAIAELDALVAEKQAAGDKEAEAQVRVAYGRRLSMSDEHDDAVAQFDWVLKNAADSPYAVRALTEKASNLWRRKDYEGCKALLERVATEYPGTPEAARVPGGIANCVREMER